jgi:hypothetical protein
MSGDLPQRPPCGDREKGGADSRRTTSGVVEAACSAGVPCHDQPRPPPSTRHTTLATARSAQGTSAFKPLPQSRCHATCGLEIIRWPIRRGTSSVPGILAPKSREARPPNVGSRDSGRIESVGGWGRPCRPTSRSRRRLRRARPRSLFWALQISREGRRARATNQSNPSGAEAAARQRGG